MNDSTLQYPIGRYQPAEYSEELKAKRLLDLGFLPKDLERALLNLDEWQLNTPYREGGWSVKEVTHHIADSHMNAYVRFKLGLTEENPVIKPYLEKEWVKLQDVTSVPVNVSVTLLYALHQRLVATIQNLSQEDFERTVFDPEQQKPISLWFLLGLYAWHGKHHVAHITSIRERNNW